MDVYGYTGWITYSCKVDIPKNRIYPINKDFAENHFNL